jgi:hypothetical protein
MPTDMLHPAVREHLRATMDPVDYAAIDVPAIVMDDNGEPAMNSAKYGVKWQFLTTDPNPLELPDTIGGAGTAKAIVQRAGVDGGDIEFIGAMAKSEDRFAVLVKSQSLNLELCNRPVCSSLIFGKGTAGSPWAAPFYEPSDGAMIFECANRIAGANNPEIVLPGRRFIGQVAQDEIEARRAKFLTSRINPFFVGPDANDDEEVEFTLPAGGTLDLECTLPSVGDFLAVGLRDDSTRVGGGRPKFKMSMKDGLTSYDLMPEPVSVELVAALSPLAGVEDRFPAASFEGPHCGIITHLFARSGKILLHYESSDNADITVRQALWGALCRYKPVPGRGTNVSERVRAEMFARSVPAPFRNIVSGGRS